jgi:hypothetical protein
MRSEVAQMRQDFNEVKDEFLKDSTYTGCCHNATYIALGLYCEYVTVSVPPQ